MPMLRLIERRMRPSLLFEHHFVEPTIEEGLCFKAEATLVMDDLKEHAQDAKAPENSQLFTLKMLEHSQDRRASSVRQRDIFDDGEPPPPRAGWPVQQLNLICIVKALEHVPIANDPGIVPYFSLELNIGGQAYKTPVCCGDSTAGRVIFDQVFNALVGDEIFDGLSKSMQDGTEGPCFSATCYDCSRRLNEFVVGHVVLSMADLLEIQQEGWHTLACRLVNSEGKDVIGRDGCRATLSMAFNIDERCKIKVGRYQTVIFCRCILPFL
jgi:hypothetical protein